MKLSELIKEYREQHGISQRQLAAQCKLSKGYISLIEKEFNPQTGKKMIPSITILNKLANGMGLQIDELFNLCDDMPITLNSDDKFSSGTGSEQKTATKGDGIDEELIQLFSLLTPEEKAMLRAQIKGILASRKQ